MKKATIITILLAVTTTVWAQGIDEDRMNRDLEIAKNILSTLIKGDTEFYFGASSVGATYVEGYGVIITIPKHYTWIQARSPRPAIGLVRIRDAGNNDAVIVYEDVKKYAKEQAMLEAKQESLEKEQAKLEEQEEKLSKEQFEKIEDQMAEIEVKVEELAVLAEEMEMDAFEWQEEYTASMEETIEKTEQAVITFLADYADLIAQLKASDNILVKQDTPYGEYAVIWDDSDGTIESPGASVGFSAEVSKKSVSDYKAGKLTFDAFKSKVTIKRSEPDRKSPDLDMFTTIFKQYFGPKMSKTFFTESSPSYEILDNFGVIFNIRTYSSYVDGKYYIMPAIGKEKVSTDERKLKIEELYPKFENDLKSFIIDYGRTIRSLKDDDILLLKIRMTRCEDCAIPKSIDVTVKMSILKQFDQQKISREKAISMIEVKKNNNTEAFNY